MRFAADEIHLPQYGVAALSDDLIYLATLIVLFMLPNGPIC